MGVTTVHDFVVPSYLRAFQSLHTAGRLHLRAVVTPYVEFLDAMERAGLETGWGDDTLRLGGVKVFADGSIGGHTAALRRPYADQPHSQGKLNWTDAQLRSHVDQAIRAGLQPSVHAIGDAAIDQVLDAYERVPAARRRRLRPRIEHFEIHHPDQVERARDLGVVLSMQPNFVGTWSDRGGMYHLRFGDDRYRRNNEFARILRAGATLAFGSDCMPFDPWWGLECALRPPHAGQRLPLPQALHAYTHGAAYGLRLDGHRGSLRPGHAADLLLLDGDWRRSGGVAATRVRAAWIGGRPVHGRPA
jgi:predicted amidohydrolase YtcJ